MPGTEDVLYTERSLHPVGRGTCTPDSQRWCCSPERHCDLHKVTQNVIARGRVRPLLAGRPGRWSVHSFSCTAEFRSLTGAEEEGRGWASMHLGREQLLTFVPGHPSCPAIPRSSSHLPQGGQHGALVASLTPSTIRGVIPFCPGAPPSSPHPHSVAGGGSRSGGWC